MKTLVLDSWPILEWIGGKTALLILLGELQQFDRLAEIAWRCRCDS